MRKGKVMRYPVRWIDRGSDVWFGVAAALANAVTVVAIARFIGGKPLGERRILIASASYSVFMSGLFCLIGFLAGDAIRAL